MEMNRDHFDELGNNGYSVRFVGEEISPSGPSEVINNGKHETSLAMALMVIWSPYIYMD